MKATILPLFILCACFSSLQAFQIDSVIADYESGILDRGTDTIIKVYISHIVDYNENNR